MKPSRDASRFVEIMAALRSPGTGCAWDLEQTFESIVPYTIEESYEIADAVARDDMTQKMIRRHPHVFGVERGLTPDEVRALWED